MKMYFMSFSFNQHAHWAMCPPDQEYLGCAIECSSRSAACTNEVEQPGNIAALQKVRCCPEASCHLPTEALGWFNLVLAQTPLQC